MAGLFPNSHRGSKLGPGARGGVWSSSKPNSHRGLSTRKLRLAEGHWYIDEPFMYVVNGTKYYVHQNHLFSVSAVTDVAGAVKERYSYSGYGERTIRTTAWAIVSKSQVANDIGFTGYVLLNETKQYYARTRQFSSNLGAFIGRDSLVYVDGLSQYLGYFIPNSLDPSGMYDCSTVVVLAHADDVDRLAKTPPPVGACSRLNPIGCYNKDNYDDKRKPFGDPLAGFANETSSLNAHGVEQSGNLVTPGMLSITTDAEVANLRTKLDAVRNDMWRRGFYNLDCCSGCTTLKFYFIGLSKNNGRASDVAVDRVWNKLFGHSKATYSSPMKGAGRGAPNTNDVVVNEVSDALRNSGGNGAYDFYVFTEEYYCTSSGVEERRKLPLPPLPPINETPGGKGVPAGGRSFY